MTDPCYETKDSMLSVEQVIEVLLERARSNSTSITCSTDNMLSFVS